MKHQAILLSSTLLALAACHRMPTTSIDQPAALAVADLPVSRFTAYQPVSDAPAPMNSPSMLTDFNKDLVKGNLDFAVDLYQQLFEADKNQFVSPFSISSALAMTYRGAAGTTAEEMQKVLHFAPNTAEFHRDFHDLNQTIEQSAKNNKIDIRVANRLWGSLKYEFKKDFLADVQQFYQGGFERTDMQKPDKVVKEVNSWVESKTENKIKDLLRPEHITPITHLILVNAIYFLGSWATDFEEQMTYEQDFNKADKQKVKAKFMHTWQKRASDLKTPYRYHEDDLGQWLDLPYANNGASMILFLPNEKMGLEAAVKKLSGDKIAKAMDKLAPPAVPLYIAIPKWKATYDLSLKETLTDKLGMTNAFSDGADFSQMSEPGQIPLKIGNVIHKAFIDVSEKGTEAAAATAVIMVETTSASREPIKDIRFTADRPYLYFIRDNSTGSLLFMGHIADPN